MLLILFDRASVPGDISQKNTHAATGTLNFRWTV